MLPIDRMPQGPPEVEVFLGESVLLGLLIRGQYVPRLGRLGIRCDAFGPVSMLWWDFSGLPVDDEDGA